MILILKLSVTLGIFGLLLLAVSFVCITIEAIKDNWRQTRALREMNKQQSNNNLTTRSNKL